MGGARAVIAAPAPRALEDSIRAQAYGLGFDLVGITTLGSMETAPYFDRWLERGYAGDMHYLPKWAHKRRDSRLPYEGVRSAIVVAMNYGGAEPSGPVARYARGDDYHDVLDAKLRELHAWTSAKLGREIRGRAYVDTGPLLERDLARRAGLGWFGKNTNLIHPKLGSFFFLGALLLDLELAPDEPFETDHCGTCTRCIDACPTQAIVEERVLDATKCISYLTIEEGRDSLSTKRIARRADLRLRHLPGCVSLEREILAHASGRKPVCGARFHRGERRAHPRARSARDVAGGVQPRLQELADEAREAPGTQAQRGGGVGECRSDE